MSGVMVISYNPFLDAETGAAYMNFKVTELLKFWTEKIVEIDPTERERSSLILLLEKVPEVVRVPRSEMKVELRLVGKSDILSTNLGTVWKLLRPSWCPHPQVSLNEELTERLRLSLGKNEGLGNLNVIHNLILRHRKESEGVMSKLNESPKKLDPGSCLDLASGGGEPFCDGRSCVKIQSFQGKDLATWFGDITEKEKSEVQIVAECYASTTVNLATALAFFSRMCSLDSLEMLESEHHLVTALSVESGPGVLQMVQKHIKGWKIGLEEEMGFPVSEAYRLPMNAMSLLASVMASVCGSYSPLHMAMV